MDTNRPSLLVFKVVCIKISCVVRPLNRTSSWDVLGFWLLLSHRFASLNFPPIPFHPRTSNSCSISPLLSSLLVIRPANFNLLPLWVGCTSGTYFTGGTIPIFTPCTGRYEETLTICFQQQQQPVSVNMQLAQQQRCGLEV